MPAILAGYKNSPPGKQNVAKGLQYYRFDFLEATRVGLPILLFSAPETLKVVWVRCALPLHGSLDGAGKHQELPSDGREEASGKTLSSPPVLG